MDNLRNMSYNYIKGYIMKQNNQVSKLILVFLAAAFLIFIPNSMSAKVLNPMLNSHGSNVKNNYTSIPLFFEANQGQVQKKVKFLARGESPLTGIP